MTMRHITMIAAMLWAGAAATQTPPAGAPMVAPDGTVRTPGETAVPLSALLSPEGQAALRRRLLAPQMSATVAGIGPMRDDVRRRQGEAAAAWLAIYPADIVSSTMGGVHVETITPKAGVASGNARRVLINLHGGGFLFGAVQGGRQESVAMAGTGRIKVVAVDYRLAPEVQYPAASEDVAAVYRALLKTYRPENIGIYGCSAGGALTGQAAAWIEAHGLPRPGALGIFCSGLMPGFWMGGDSQIFSRLSNPPMILSSAGAPDSLRPYIKPGDATDPLAVPGPHPEVLAKFPPTLFITGTRDVAMSNVLVTNIALQKAGVKTRLLVQEGMGHSDFNAFAGAPESQAAWDEAWRWFDSTLGR